MQHVGHDFLLRLTSTRFRSLQKQARLVDRGDNFRVGPKTWKPSPKERPSNPELPPDAALEVRLHEVVISPELTLHTVTGLPDYSATVPRLYECRNHVEVEIRNLKVVLNTEQIHARRLGTFRKELLAAMASYNLVTQFRCQAAQLIHEPPRRSSSQMHLNHFTSRSGAVHAQLTRRWAKQIRHRTERRDARQTPQPPRQTLSQRNLPPTPKLQPVPQTKTKTQTNLIQNHSKTSVIGLAPCRSV